MKRRTFIAGSAAMMAMGTRPEPSLADLGLPPQNGPAEQYVLGALLNQAPGAFRLAEISLEADDFADPLHGKIFAAIMEVWSSCGRVDRRAVEHKVGLKPLMEVGGTPYLGQLIDMAKLAEPSERHKLPELKWLAMEEFADAVMAIRECCDGPYNSSGDEWDSVRLDAWDEIFRADYGDAIANLMWNEGISFREATARLRGDKEEGELSA